MTPVRFQALDGLELGGALFTPPGGGEPAVVALLATGGGIDFIRYHHFLEYLAANGIPAFGFDYRGIGASRPATLRNFHAGFEDWSEFDCGGAIAMLQRRFPRSAIAGIGHSIGGLLLAGAPNAAMLRRVIFVCPHSGYCGDYLPKWRLLMTLVWHVLAPGIARMVGYFPARLFRLGNDLPARVTMQWGSRTTPELNTDVQGDPDGRFAAVFRRTTSFAGPAMIVVMPNDGFATEAGIQRLLASMPRLHSVRMPMIAAGTDPRIQGHWGFFRRRARQACWSMALDYIKGS